MKSSSEKIARNSSWYAIELGLETIVFLGTNVAVARYLGLTKLGHFSYINLFVSIMTRTGGTGMSSATRKYMSEYLGQGRPGMARAVYQLAHRYQLLGASTMAVLGLLSVVLFGDRDYRWMSVILMVSIVPGLMSTVPAEANTAFEDVSKNTISAFGYIFSYALLIFLTIHFRWDLVGVAAAGLIGRTIEVFLRTIPLNRRLREYPLERLDQELIRRIRLFCLQAMGLQVIMTVVFDRTELFFLRAYSTFDQIGMYSVSFGLANNLLTAPRVLGSGVGATLMVEASRDPRRVDSIVQNACRYLMIISFPVCVGAATIALPTVRLLYGKGYIAAVPTMLVASLLIIPRVFQWIPDLLLRTADRQNRMLLWYGITGVVNIGLDMLLIPRYGSVGAAWGNGLGQLFCVVVSWWQARRFYTFHFPSGTAVRIGLATAVMATVSYSISHALGGAPGVVLGVLAAALSNIVLLGVLRALPVSDQLRLAPIGNRMPGPVRRIYLATIGFATGATRAKTAKLDAA